MPKKLTTTPTEQLGQLLSTKEAAPLLGLDLKTLLQWRHRNYGPESFKVGRKVVWPKKPLMAWLEQQRAATSKGGDVQ